MKYFDNHLWVRREPTHIRELFGLQRAQHQRRNRLLCRQIFVENTINGMSNRSVNIEFVRQIMDNAGGLHSLRNHSHLGNDVLELLAAPERKSDLARVGLRAMFGGALASWLTATIAGILLS